MRRERRCHHFTILKHYAEDPDYTYCSFSSFPPTNDAVCQQEEKKLKREIVTKRFSVCIKQHRELFLFANFPLSNK